MNTLNYIFFENFKTLEKLCNDKYKTTNGVTHYIDEMKSISSINCKNIPNWTSDFNQLKRLRHIRNYLAHTEGAFNENNCTQNDIEWLQIFYNRILAQSDPLSMYRRCYRPYIQTPQQYYYKNAEIPTPKPHTQTSFKESIFISIMVIITAILALLIACVLYAH